MNLRQIVRNQKLSSFNYKLSDFISEADDEEVKKKDAFAGKTKAGSSKYWYVNKQGQMKAVVNPPKEGGWELADKDQAKEAEEREKDIESAADNFMTNLSRLEQSTQISKIDKNILDEAAVNLLQIADTTFGGFGQAPKFPNASNISFMFRYSKISGISKFKDFALLTLKKMARGGIFDQIGGGFHRYSTDARWLVPHFEKMLYDNALLPVAYCEAYQITKDPFFLDVVRKTLDYVIREMTSSEGKMIYQVMTNTHTFFTLLNKMESTFKAGEGLENELEQDLEKSKTTQEFLNNFARLKFLPHGYCSNSNTPLDYNQATCLFEAPKGMEKHLKLSKSSIGTPMQVFKRLLRSMLGMDDPKTLATIMSPQVLSIFEEDYMLKSEDRKALEEALQKT